MDAETRTGVLIPYLVEMFRFQAWMAMGKVANPVSGEVERNLDAARQMIDLLGELEERTEGHRSSDETKLLQGVLTELRLNFMDESQKPERDESKAGDPETQARAGEGTEKPRSEETAEPASGSEAGDKQSGEEKPSGEKQSS